MDTEDRIKNLERMQSMLAKNTHILALSVNEMKKITEVLAEEYLNKRVEKPEDKAYV